MEHSALPIPRATLDDYERNRNASLGALLAGFDALAAGMDAARLAAVSFSGEVEISDDAKRALFAGNDKRQNYGRGDVRTWREVFADETRKTIDRAVWSHVIQATDLEKLMDRQAREEFRDSLMTEPPEPTAANIAATLRSFLGEAPHIFQRGIANAFAKLDRRFRSHDGFKIGGRIILDRYFSESGLSTSRGSETLRDIERAFSLLDDTVTREEKDREDLVAELRHRVGWSTPRPVVIESRWVRIRVFQNGNAHLWFTRPDLVRKVNRVLADWYGEAIGEGSDVADVSAMGPGYHITPARDFGFFPTSEETARRLFERIPSGYGQAIGCTAGARVLEPSAGKGALASIAKGRGADVHCVEIQHGMAAELRRDGFNVTEGDFLQMTPGQLGMFDGVVMNPPFDRGRDCDHVRHALQFVKPGGWLVAIMSAGAEFREDKRTASFRALLDKECVTTQRYGRGIWDDLPEGSFAHAGTNVNTVTLAVRKRPAA